MSKLSDEILVLKKNDKPDVSEKSKTDSIPDTPSNESSPDIDDYPDGGLRAWMVVCGVRAFYYS
jgi:hypothetical protein